MKLKFFQVRLKWVWILLFGCCCSAAMAQSPNFWSHVRYGGGLGLSFGRESVQIGVAPTAIYQANEYVAFGLGLNYTYSKFFDTRLNAFGGSAIGLVNPIPALQVSGEFEQLRVNQDFGFASESYWLPALYFGLGYTSGPVTFGVRFDVLHDRDRSLYADPWVPFVRVFF
ncbi:alpha-ketoglutarate decarboxylase [Robiginitalea marina]|uniref:Alpha-ketoglutarate decarboxylase n=1 Tax=Robiginitalea marina TaxID=2954105 RepID=A0ABT1AY66_9FLAO|nr:alpha-ketoglutarate decarboxylase [Robiginitalea marina]MCO5724922.1 alpha-ketoglutarate decarboxylase [Robiginitalea marina]